MWNITVYMNGNHSTCSAAECVVVLRLAVNIINDRCCKFTSYSAALWWTSTVKLGGGDSFEPLEPPLGTGLLSSIATAPSL